MGVLKHKPTMQDFWNGFIEDMAQRFPITKSLILGVAAGLGTYFHGLRIPALEIVNIGWIGFSIGLIKAIIVAGATTLTAKMVSYGWDNRKKYFTRVKNKMKRKKPKK